MIFCQVGKGRNIKMHTAHPIQGDGMRGYLHNNILTACVPHTGKQALKFKTLRRGPLCWHHQISDLVFHGADKADLCPTCLFQHLLQKKGNGSLSVGACYTDHGHAFCRMTVEITTDQRKRLPVRFHQNVRDIPFRSFRRYHCGSAFFQSHRDKPVSVSCKTGYGNKQTA